jgi:NAD(P)-dependent dehydrogenase (short-subunit alcohol dehydrogenase family)
MNSPFSLVGKRIFVTGASSGIGKMVALECSKMGAKLVITGRNEQRLKSTFVQLSGDNHSFFVADLSNNEDVDNIIKEIDNPINGIVHSAGFNKLLPFQFVNQESLDDIFRVNYFAPTLLTQGLVKKKKLEKGTSIVFISSISGVYCSSVGSSMYSSTKGAINGLVKGMSLDLANKNMRVNCINPGVIETEIFKDGKLTTEQLNEKKSEYPLKRFGKPEEVAWAAVYLLSDASSWVTGTNLVIDGGFTLR